jgi:glycosyltransferase involved in cell wall biosynthesis
MLGVRAYVDRVARTILVGPMDTGNVEEMARLVAPGNRLEIRYSSYHGVDEVGMLLSNRLHVIEGQYNVRILYGTRAFGDARHEVVLVEGRWIAPQWVNAYKGRLYDRFGIQSDRYEHDPEYAMHVNAAEPAYKALQAVLSLGMHGHQDAGAASGARRFIIAHEFMGLPLCYSATLHDPGAYRTIFYGHEVTTVRPIVEFHPGHDTMFYNVLARAQEQGLYLETVFGDQSGFFKHGLIRPAAANCDRIFAVGDQVVAEMRFLGLDWAGTNIDLVYNGVPSDEISLDDKKASRNRLQQYCLNLLGYRPDYVFTHVTRFIPSKGLWRDLRVMEHLDGLLAERGQRAVLFVLSSVIPVGRPPKAVMAMEAAYGWPAYHREATIHVDDMDVPDLVAHEIPFHRAIEAFNRTARASRVVLVNQYGWSRDRCGWQMPADMEFMDIRYGSDLEFGQSVYEPFGIAQLEPLSFGALCVVSNVCGCVGFLRQAGGQDIPNVIVANYVADRTGQGSRSLQGALAIDQAYRDQIEAAQAGEVAQQIVDRLPQDDAEAQQLLEKGFAISQKMSWQVVVEEYLLPGLARATHR